MTVGRERGLGRLAMVHGIVGLATCLSLIVFFIAGGAFGAINDVGNAVFGLLSAGLAWLWPYSAPRALVGVAALGAAITVVGSILILTDTTGYFLAGLVSSTGFAVLGIWLAIVNRGLAAEQWPRQLHRAGLIAAVVMLLGFVNVPGIAMGLDDQATAPAWTYLGGVSWAGTYLLFPLWSIRLSRTISAPSQIPTEKIP